MKDKVIVFREGTPIENPTLYQGIVADVLENGDVIVLTPDGDIEQVKTHRAYQLGERILFYEQIREKKGLFRRILAWLKRIFQ